MYKVTFKIAARTKDNVLIVKPTLGALKKGIEDVCCAKVAREVRFALGSRAALDLCTHSVVLG